MRRLAIALTCGAIALVGVACGGDDEPDATGTTTTPELTVPQTVTPDTQTTTTPPPTITETQPPPATGPSGGTTAPATPQQQDSPENDSPAPKGSPAEKFEKFCDENPGACG
jgi:hypothetical protein